jgi:hypothetical protein
MIPIVYKSTDDNAPVLSGTRGSLINVLKKCLVEGYGDKAAAGWTLEFINGDSTIACFQNSAVNGSGVFLKVDELAPANAFNANLQSYETMTAYDAGIGPFLASLAVIWKSDVANTASRPWVVIADAAFFFFFCLYHGSFTEIGNIVFFGNLIRNNVDDAYACALGWGCQQAYNINSGFYGAFDTINTAGNSFYGVSRPLGGTTPAQRNLSLVTGGGPFSFLSGISGAGWYSGPVFANDKLYLSRPLLVDGNSYNPRGWIPGFYLPCHHPDTFTHLQQITIDGRTFLCLKSKCLYNSTNGVQRLYFIEIGAEWA